MIIPGAQTNFLNSFYVIAHYMKFFATLLDLFRRCEIFMEVKKIRIK